MENVVEPDGGMPVGVRMLPGVPRQIGLRFPFDQSPVDRGHVIFLRNRQRTLKGAAHSARHVFGAKNRAMVRLQPHDALLELLRVCCIREKKLRQTSRSGFSPSRPISRVKTSRLSTRRWSTAAKDAPRAPTQILAARAPAPARLYSSAPNPRSFLHSCCLARSKRPNPKRAGPAQTLPRCPSHKRRAADIALDPATLSRQGFAPSVNCALRDAARVACRVADWGPSTNRTARKSDGCDAARQSRGKYRCAS